MDSQTTTPMDSTSQTAGSNQRVYSKPIRWWNSKTSWKQLGMAGVFVGPWIIGLLAFTIYPIYYTVRLSFTRYAGFGEMEWIGLGNYRRMLFDDPIFWQSMWNTFYYTGLAVPIGAVMAMVIALAMNQNLPEIP